MKDLYAMELFCEQKIELLLMKYSFFLLLHVNNLLSQFKVMNYKSQTSKARHMSSNEFSISR